jgi:hypothetical protein
LSIFAAGSAAAMVVKVRSTASLIDALSKGKGSLAEELRRVCKIKSKGAAHQKGVIQLEIKKCLALPSVAEELLYLNKPTLAMDAELQKWLEVGINIKYTAYHI